MRIIGMLVVVAMATASSLVAQERPVDEVVFTAALAEVRHHLQGAPPASPLHKWDGRDLPAEAIVVAQRTIDGAPNTFRSFVDEHFGTVIANELAESHGEKGPAPRAIEQKTAAGFTVLPVQEFESGRFDYDWSRLNQKYPLVRYVVRLSWPVVDSVGTYAAVRYELIGRDQPSTASAERPWQHASFAKFEKQSDGSWKRGAAVIGALWN